MPPKPGICARRDRVVRMRRQPGIAARRSRAGRARATRRARARSRCGAPCAAAASSARGRAHRPACGSRIVPSSRRVRSTRCTSVRASGHRPRRDVAVPVEVLRRAVHHEIDAERQRLLVDRAGERVVEHRHDPAGAARGGDRADVDAAQGRVDRRLEPQQPRRRPPRGGRPTPAPRATRSASSRRSGRGDPGAGGACRRRSPALQSDLVAGLEERR